MRLFYSKKLVNVYDSRIGRASTEDEAMGYWIFAAGVALGFFGLGVVLLSMRSGQDLSEIGMVLTSVSVVLLMVGQIVRLPLTNKSLPFIYVGSVLSIAAGLWFGSAYPDQWTSQFANNEPLIIGLYGLGILVISVAGIVTPLVSSQRKQKEEAEDELAKEKGDRLLEEEAARERLNKVKQFKQDVQEELDDILDSQSQFEMFKDDEGQYRWRLRHSNGNVIADSNQGYSSKQKSQQGLTAVRRDSIGATVMDVEFEEDKKGDDLVQSSGSQSHFETYEDEGGKYRWRLRHNNGNILCDSGQGYESKQSRDYSLESIGQYVLTGKYLKLDPIAFEIFVDEDDLFRWHLVHKNGRIMARSGLGYSSRQQASEGIQSVRKDIEEGESNVEIYEDNEGDYRWKLMHNNGNNMASSVKGFSEKSEVSESLERVRSNIDKSETFEVEKAAFELYKDEGGKYRWRLRHKNGNILCDSGQGYSNRGGAIKGINSIKRDIKSAETKKV